MDHESERTTRKRRIDPRLKAAGWSIVPFRPSMPATPPRATAVEEWPTVAGPADYALCDNASVRGVVEAKKLTVGPGGVLTQAERYSRGLDQEPRCQGEFGAPFLYSTNGETIRFHDVRSERNLSREVAGFHTPTALAEMLQRDLDAELAKLTEIPMSGRLRPYQQEANEAIEQAIAQGNLASLSMTKLRELPVPVPSLDEQAEIVRRVGRLLDVADQLQGRVEAATRKVDRSSQAVLGKAFRGDLGLAPHGEDAASADGSFSPAGERPEANDT